MSLKALRAAAPPQDRNDPALVPTAQPAWATGRDGGRHVSIGLYPRTPDELRKMARGSGEAAIAELRWQAVGLWLMKDSPAPPVLKHPYSVASEAVSIAQQQARYRLGWPTHDGKPAVNPVLDGMTAGDLTEALAVSADTLTDWEGAGCPYSGPDKITDLYRFLVSTPAFINTYIGPDRATNTKDII